MRRESVFQILNIPPWQRAGRVRAASPILISVPLWERAQEAKNKRCKKRTKTEIIALIVSLLFIFAVINLLICDNGVAFAKDSKSEEELKEELGEVFGDTVNGLDVHELEEFIRSLDAEGRQAVGIEDVKATLKALVGGEPSDFFKRFWDVLAKSVGKYFLGFMPAVITVIIICLLKNMLGSLTGDFLNTSTTEVVHLICYIAIIIVLMSGIGSVIATVTKTIDGLVTLSGALFPILLTLLSMLGGTASVATYTPFVAAIGSTIMKLVSAVIVPAFTATAVLGMVGNLSKTVKLDRLTKLIKSASGWLIGIVFGLFATFLTVQGISGGVADKFGLGIAKFALSSYVPILGGYLSDGMDLLSASLVLTKNALGYTGVILLVGAVVFPLVKVVLFSLAMRLAAAIAEPLGDARVASLMSGVASNVSLLITALAGVAFLFFLLLMLFISSCNVL